MTFTPYFAVDQTKDDAIAATGGTNVVKVQDNGDATGYDVQYIATALNNSFAKQIRDAMNASIGYTPA